MRSLEALLLVAVALQFCFHSCQGPLYPTSNGPPAAKDACPKECSCSSNLTVINCKGKRLSTIPVGIPSTAVIVYLGYNSLSKIDSESFKNLKSLRELDLNDNKISFIDDYAFGGLTSLRTLSLTENKLTYLKSEALADLKGVEKLYLTRNNLGEMPDLASIPMNNLSVLTIDNNNLANVNLCKSKRAYYGKLSNLVLSNNNLESLNQTDFECVNETSLTKINLSRNRIKKIANDTFSSLTELQSIILSYNNNFPWETLMNLTRSFSKAKKLSSLDLSGVFVNGELEFNASTFFHITKCPLRYLLLSHSTKESIENGTFSHLSKLETLDLSQGELSEIKDSMVDLKKLKDLRLQQNNNLRMSFVPKLSLPSLETLNLGLTNIKELHDNFFRGFHSLKKLILSRCHIEKIHSEAFLGLASLVELDLSKNEIGGTNIPSKLFSVCPNVKNINLSGNKMTTMSTQYTLFEGIFLEQLDMSDNDCNDIAEGIFGNQKNLKVLNLSGNKLGHYFSVKNKTTRLFDDLSSLELLLLNRNDISLLPDNLFDGMTSTKTINLSTNYISSFRSRLFRNTTSLKIIDLSRNRLIQILPEDVTTLPSQTTLDLSDNMFDCSCDLRPFMYWLRTQNSSYKEYKLVNIKNYRCETPLHMTHKPLLEFNPDSITAFCNWVYILIGSLVALFVIVFTCGMLIFHYRWSIRFRWFLFTEWSKKKSRKHRGTTYGSIPSTAEDYAYEMTISFHKQNEDWVLNDLIPRLEQWKKGIHDIDIQSDYCNQDSGINDDPSPGFLFAEGYTSKIGGSFFSDICKAMTKSKRIVHCISKDYLKSTRHRQEIEVAIYSRHELNLDIKEDQGLFLILLEPNIDLTLPPQIRPLRACNKFCEWSTDPTRATLFWIDLQRALKLNQID